MKYVSVLFYILFSALINGSAYSQVSHTEATGSYSGLFVAYEPFKMTIHPSAGQNETHQIEHEDYITTLTAMYPGKIFGFGLEVPFLRRAVHYSSSDVLNQNFSYNKIGDIRLVAKYQFGIYKNYNLFGRERLLNMLVSLVGKLKLPNAATNIRGVDGVELAPFLQPGSGSTDLTLGFIFHTDTQKYFRILGHFSTTFSLAHRAYSPGEKIHFTLSYIFARLGIKNRYYPFLGFKGWWKAQDRLDNTPLYHTEGLHLYLSPGLRTAWWYFPGHRMFCMVQTAVQIKVIETGDVMAGPSFGFYCGTRIFFR